MGDKYLNSTGLSHFWAKIKAFFVKGNGKVFVGTCASDAAEVDKVVTCSDFAASDLVAGTTIYVTFGETNSGAVGSLTMNVNGTGAKHIKYINNNAIGNIPGAGYLVAGLMYQFIYDGTYWVVQMNYNTNSNDSTTGYGRHTYGTWKPTTALGAYVLSFTKDETQIVPVTAVNKSTATTKALTTETFNPFEPIFYYARDAQVSAGTAIGASYLWFGYDRVDIRYSFNTGTTLTANKDVYIKCVLQDDGTAKLATGNPIVQDLPSTADGFIYICLGHACDTYRVSITFTHNVYEFKNGGIQLLTRDAATVNGHTVATDVPSGAKFTDTTYTAASATPLMDNGSGAVGSSTKYAREDHKHPADTTRVSVTQYATDQTAVNTAIDNLNDELANKVDKISGKGLSTNDFTDALETKLSGIATGAEVNQNAFSNVKVGSTTVAADSKTDTLELVAGSNVTLTPDATNDKVTIAATDTVTTVTSSGSGNAVTAITASNGKLTVTKGSTFLTSHQDISGKVDKVSGMGLSTNDFSDAFMTKLAGIATGAEVNQNAYSNVKVGSTTVAADAKTDTLELVAGSNVTLTPDATNDKITIAATDTTYTNLTLGQGYGTCATAAATVAKVGTLSGYTLTTGGVVAIKFTYAVPANATLNINSKGAKAIRHKGAAIKANVILAGDTATFLYDGSYYQLLAVDRATTSDVVDDLDNSIIRFPNGMAMTWGAQQVTFTTANYVDVTILLQYGFVDYKVFFSITSTNSTQALAPIVELRTKDHWQFTVRVWKNLSSTATMSFWLGWFLIG